MTNLRRAVFFDLQGTLGGDGLGDIRTFSFFPWSARALRTINLSGMLALVATNQSHIARGFFTQAAFDQRMAALQLELAVQGARLDGVYCCPHSSKVGDDCDCRKPKPGLLLRAQYDFSLNLSACFVVGDAGAWDMLMAKAAGCRAVLVRTGLGESSLGEYRSSWANMEPDFIADNALQAADWISAADPVNPSLL